MYSIYSLEAVWARGMGAQAVYRSGSEEVKFVGGVKPPVDESRDASAPVSPEDPLYQVRTDIESIQYQINTFLTERMNAQQPKKAKLEQ